MNAQKQINMLTSLLAAAAGFCDTATFVSGDFIFSAHVTGNFIVFAAQVIIGGEGNAWIKLLTFPVFVVSVIIGGWLADTSDNKYFLLLIESLLLFACSAATGFLSLVLHSHPGTGLYAIVMMAVTAMGLQNAFGKLYAKETHGPTTMMTGNVTQVSLDLGKLLCKGLRIESSASLRKQMYLIGGFLLGCLTGAIISNTIGLSSLFIPAVIVMTCYGMMRRSAVTTTFIGLK